MAITFLIIGFSLIIVITSIQTAIESPPPFSKNKRHYNWWDWHMPSTFPNNCIIIQFLFRNVTN